MVVLKAGEYGEAFKSTHAYLAEKIAGSGSIYDLHNGANFHRDMADAFALASFADGTDSSGLSLVIPYPHDGLKPDGVLAAAIDHFAPAILNGTLIVVVDKDTLNRDTIEAIAASPPTAAELRTPVKEGAKRYLDLIRAVQADGGADIAIDVARPDWGVLRNQPHAAALREGLAKTGEARLTLRFDLRRNGEDISVHLVAIARLAPYGKPPMDRLFREGMALPEVKARRPADIDLVLLVDDEPLAQYLNFCEGKAHLDLLETREVRDKLAEKGFDYPAVRVKRFVKSLPDALRTLLTEEKTEPDASVWENWFSVSDPTPERTTTRKRRETKAGETETVTPDPPSSNPPAVLVDTVRGGFRLRANPDYRRFPATVVVTAAYADGTRKPGWSEYDFRPRSLATRADDCSAIWTDNVLELTDWNKGSEVEVTGFGDRRELVVRFRSVGDAAND